MRLNKSFVVHREIKGVKETLRKLSKLSAYINQSLWLDKESIWIAQKQGRANDGNDFSDEGVLKMMFLNERKSKSINEWRKAVNLTPIVISYEYDPLDSVKAKGWDHQEDWSLEQRNKNDIHELSTGIFGYKGRVHLHICKPICREIESTRDLSETIQKEILSNYHIWPTNEAALSLLPQLNPDNLINSHPSKYREALALLKSRSEMLGEKERKAFLMAYARPLINKKKAKLSSGL